MYKNYGVPVPAKCVAVRKKQCGTSEIPANRHPPALYEKYTGVRVAAFHVPAKCVAVRKKKFGNSEIKAKRHRPKQKNEAPALYEKYTLR
jgi:hypothetical protein